MLINIIVRIYKKSKFGITFTKNHVNKYKIMLINIKIKLISIIVRIYKKLKFSIIFDKNLILPEEKIIEKKTNYKFYSKEILVRNFLFKKNNSNKLNFLDMGGRDGAHSYILKYDKNFKINRNFEKDKEKFENNYNYYYSDIKPLTEKSNCITGDICDEKFLSNKAELMNSFDIIYSNNVFEHLKKPWIACANINKMLKVNGACITIVPFSQRYHESPVDCFRYTHEGIRYLFENEMEIEIIAQGYDIDGRRNNWNGVGLNNDYVPEDNFGAWRETWFTVFIFKKIKSII